MSTLSDRDRAILNAEIAGEVAQLRPLTEMGIDWRPTFEAEAARWRAISNGRVGDAKSDANRWHLAYRFLLDEAVA